MIDGRKGVLSVRLAGGDGPWLWLLAGEYISTFPLVRLGAVELRFWLGVSSDLCIP